MFENIGWLHASIKVIWKKRRITYVFNSTSNNKFFFKACQGSHEYDSLKLAYIVGMITVLMVGIFGNSVVILAVVKSHVLNSRATFRFAASLGKMNFAIELIEVLLLAHFYVFLILGFHCWSFKVL